MARAPFAILYEDNHLLVIAKPPDVPTMGVTDNRASVLSMARSYVKHRDNKPGNVYLGVVSRLDTPVSGVLLAKTSKAASRLTEQFRERDVRKDLLGGRRRQTRPTQGQARRLPRTRRPRPTHGRRQRKHPASQAGRTRLSPHENARQGNARRSCSKPAASIKSACNLPRRPPNPRRPQIRRAAAVHARHRVPRTPHGARASRDARIDGVPRAATTVAKVWDRGKRCRVIVSKAKWSCAFFGRFYWMRVVVPFGGNECASHYSREANLRQTTRTMHWHLRLFPC